MSQILKPEKVLQNRKLGIHFGAMSDSISKQLRVQKFKFMPADAKDFQDDFDSILSLWFSKLLTDSQKAKLQTKLFKRIEHHVKQQNKNL